MIKSANIATTYKRKESLAKTIETLKGQFDIIRVYGNDYLPNIEGVECYSGIDHTDNSKFTWANEHRDEYYFSCDDDILYPKNYAENTLYYLKKYDGLYITYHGRKLKQKDVSYYSGHDIYSCLREVLGNWIIDVPGTGVSAFDLRHFKVDIKEWEFERMSDLMMGLELAKVGKKILCVQHSIWWLKDQGQKGIYHEVKDETNHIKVANDILIYNNVPIN